MSTREREHSVQQDQPASRCPQNDETNTNALAVSVQCWAFFWDVLTNGQKLMLLGILGSAFLAVFVGGFRLGVMYTQSKIDAAEAKAERRGIDDAKKAADLERQLAEAKRQLTEKETSTNDEEPTIENATFDPISYAEFVSTLNEVRLQNDVTEKALIDQYHWKKVRWHCIIIKRCSSSEAYWIGASETAERKDQAFARFGKKQFDQFAKPGDRKTIEGIFETVNGSGITLFDCRFPTTTVAPTKK